MTAIFERAAGVESKRRTKLTGEILADDPQRPDRTRIAYSIGNRSLLLSVPKSSHADAAKTIPYVYHHKGPLQEGKLPDVTPWDNPQTGNREFMVDFGLGRRDAEFILSPGAGATINLLGLQERVRASVTINARRDEEVIISAEGTRNRWLKIKSGKAAELHVVGKDPATDDDIRVVIEPEAFVKDLYLYDDSAAETPGLVDPELVIGTLHVVGMGSYLNNIKLQPGHTLKDMPGLIALGRAGSRRTVDPDTFHPGTESERRNHDDPEGHRQAILAGKEAERRMLRGQELRKRAEWGAVDERREGELLLPESYYTREQKPGGFWRRRFRQAPVAEAERSADSHISLTTVDAKNRYLYSIVRNVFYKEMLDYSEVDLHIAHALAHLATGLDKLPPLGKRATILTKEGLQLIVEKDQHSELKEAIDTFMNAGFVVVKGQNGQKDTVQPLVNNKIHITELSQRTDEGWAVIEAIDNILTQRAEKQVVQEAESILDTVSFSDPSPDEQVFNKTNGLVDVNR